MSTNNRDVFRSFYQYAREVPFILFYPWSNYRQALLDCSRDYDQYGILYYQIYGGQNRLADWVMPLIQYLSSKLPEFHVPKIDTLLINDPYEAGCAIAEALHTQDGQESILFLDNLDAVPHDKMFREFIQGVSAGLVGKWRIAVSSRWLTYAPWVELVAAQQATVLGYEKKRMTLEFATQETPKPQVEFYSFEGGKMLVNGQSIDHDLDPKAHHLAAFLIEHQTVTRQQVLDTFWGDVSTRKASNSFHVEKSSIVNILNHVLGQDDEVKYEFLTHRNGIYYLAEDLVFHYDASEFEEIVMLALQEDDVIVQERLLLQASSVYRDEYLKSLTTDWVVERRNSLRQMYVTVLTKLGAIYKGYSNDEAALHYYQLAFQTNSALGDTCRELMGLLAHLDRLDELPRTLIQHECALKEVSREIELHPSTVEAYRILMARKR